jgi:hypothetical protein
MNAMTLIESPQGKVEVRYGDIGDTFYMILKGEVSVWIPCDVTTVENGLIKLAQSLSNQTAKTESAPLKFRYTNEFDETVTL